nr:hypothetical protein [Deltaproteobacteria bacterium]
MSAHDDDDLDSQHTAIDPDVPTGARARPAHFDPHARLADNRKPVVGATRPVAHEVIAALPPVRPEPVAPKTRAPSSFDPAGRIDDNSRTAQWTPRAPTEPAVPRDRSEPMRVISMKTPGPAAEPKPQRVLPAVKLRALSEVQSTPARAMGNLAPPRDPRAA